MSWLKQGINPNAFSPSWLYSFSLQSTSSLLKVLIYLVVFLNFSLFFSQLVIHPFFYSFPDFCHSLASHVSPTTDTFFLSSVLPASPSLFYLCVWLSPFQWALFLDHAPWFLDTALAICYFSPHTFSPSSISARFFLCHIFLSCYTPKEGTVKSETVSLLIVAAENLRYQGKPTCG